MSTRELHAATTQEKGGDTPPHVTPHVAWPEDRAERDWERELFLQPTRLAEAKRLQPGPNRWNGLLLAGLACLAIMSSDVRAEESVTQVATGEDSGDVGFDYWEWLEAWWNGESSTEMRKDGSGSGSGDPGGGGE